MISDFFLNAGTPVDPAAAVTRIPKRANGRRAARGRDVDEGRARAAIRDLLEALGADPDRDGLRDPPARVARRRRSPPCVA